MEEVELEDSAEAEKAGEAEVVPVTGGEGLEEALTRLLSLP